MKRRITSLLLVAGLASCALGQQVILDNIYNTGGLNATSGGLVYELPGSGPFPTAPGPLVLFDGDNYDLGVTVYGGSSAGSMSLIGTYTPANDPKGYTGAGPGQFQLGPPGEAVTVPGVAPGGLATIELLMWDYNSPYSTGTFQSIWAALDNLDLGGFVIFQNPTSNPNGPIPTPAPDLIGMPSVLFALVPEPAVLAFGGLGLAALVAVRRRR